MKRLQVADGALGRLACGLLQPLRLGRHLSRRLREGAERSPDILLVKFWGLGSLQLLTPAAEVLRERHPGSRLVLLTLRENQSFARGLGVFDEVLSLDIHSSSWVRLGLRTLALLRDLRRRRFRAVFDFEFFTRFSAVMSLLSGAPSTHGFRAPGVWRGHFHTRTVPFSREWHVARNFRSLAGGEDGREVHHLDLAAYRSTAQDEAEVDATLAGVGLAPDGPLVVLNPNAGSLSLERRWPRERFAALALGLGREHGARVAVIGSSHEVAWAEGVARMAREGGLAADRVTNLAGRLGIGGLAALLARADAFVTNDSGPMHLGAALGTPTVGLFGPETPRMYRPLGRVASALYSPPPCSPCINVHDAKLMSCHLGEPECLMRLSVEEVAEEVRLLLRRGRLRSVTPGRELEPRRRAR